MGHALDRWYGLDPRLAYAKVAALIDRQPIRESVVSVEVATMDGSAYGLRDCVLQIAGVGLANGKVREVWAVCFDLATDETKLFCPSTPGIYRLEADAECERGRLSGGP